MNKTKIDKKKIKLKKSVVVKSGKNQAIALDTDTNTIFQFYGSLAKMVILLSAQGGKSGITVADLQEKMAKSKGKASKKEFNQKINQAISFLDQISVTKGEVPIKKKRIAIKTATTYKTSLGACLVVLANLAASANVDAASCIKNPTGTLNTMSYWNISTGCPTGDGIPISCGSMSNTPMTSYCKKNFFSSTNCGKGWQEFSKCTNSNPDSVSMSGPKAIPPGECVWS